LTTHRVFLAVIPGAPNASNYGVICIKTGKNSITSKGI
jgi:hypothetical protein